MQNITIQYRPFLLPWYRTLSGSFPDKVEELNSVQLEAVAALVSGNIGDDTFLSRMTGIKQKIVKRLSPFYKFELMQLFTVFNQLAPHNQFIIKSIKVRNLVLCAPAPKLKGFTFGQFIFADTLFDDYSNAKTPAALCRFVAALYIPAGKKFSEDMIDAHTPALAPIAIGANPATLEAIAINYGLVREWLTDAYPLVFVKSEPSGSPTVPLAKGDERSGGGKVPATSNPWLKIFESLVGDDIINDDKYANKPVHSIFRFMTRKIKDNMKRK